MFLIVCVAIFVLYLGSKLIAVLRRNKAWSDYQKALNDVRKWPNDPQYRRIALQKGRYFSALTRKGKVVIFDEVAIANDLAASSAGASQQNLSQEQSVPLQDAASLSLQQQNDQLKARLEQEIRKNQSGRMTDPLQIINTGKNTERSGLSILVDKVLNFSLVILLLVILAVILVIRFSSSNTSSSRSLPKSTASDSKVNEAKKPAQAVKATLQNVLIQKIERLGFALNPKPLVMQNASSNQHAQFRIWYDASGFHSAPPENDLSSNVVTVNLEIRPDNEVAEFQVKVEIVGYKTKEAIRETKRKAANAILQFEPAVPRDIKASVTSKRNASEGSWTVEHSGENFTVVYRADRNLNGSNSSPTPDTPTNQKTESQLEKPITKADNSRSSQPEVESKLEPMKPRELISKLEKIGFRVEGIPWRESKAEDYWITQLRIYNNKNGFVDTPSDSKGRRNNEIVVQILGKSEFEITELLIEQKIHSLKDNKQIRNETVRKANEAVSQFNIRPPQDAFTKAFVAKSEARVGNWSVRCSETENTYTASIRYQNDLAWKYNSYMVKEQGQSVGKNSAGQSNNQASAMPTPQEIMEKMSLIGLKIDAIPWRKSRTANFWIAQMRVWNNDQGFVSSGTHSDGRLNNEVVVMLKGRSANDIVEFYVESEIHDFGGLDQTVATSTKMMQALYLFRRDLPKNMESALMNRTDFADRHWIVKNKPDSVTVIFQADPNWEHNERR